VLGTPVLLQQSGLAAGGGVQVHSSVHVTARFAEPIYGYYGPTHVVCRRRAVGRERAHRPGRLIESVSALPLPTASALRDSAAAHEARMRDLAHFARALVVIRDRAPRPRRGRRNRRLRPG
jgi:hypothetical protein